MKDSRHRFAVACALALCSLGIAARAHSQEAAPVAESPTAAQAAPPTPQPLTPQPLTAALPGTDIARMATRAIYISPFASLAGVRQSSNENSDLARYYRSGGRRNLARVPEMFGDYRAPVFGLTVTSTTPTVGAARTQVPVAAGTAGLRIAEVNQALPANRVYFSYSHFHNAFSTGLGAPGNVGSAGTSDQSVNRFLLGAERVFGKGATSVELRMAFGSAINLNSLTNPIDPTSGVTFESDSVGNLSVILKRMLYGDGCSALSCGLGLETPTGSDVTGSFAGTEYAVKTESVQMVPYLAYTQRGNRFFAHVFSQLDISLGNDPLLASTGGPLQTIGEINRGLLLGFDVGLGYWLVRPANPGDRGIAFVSEVHYTTALDKPEATGGQVGAVTFDTDNVDIGDLINLTQGLEFSMNGWGLRTGIVVPIRDQRVFDTEAQLQLTRAY